MESESGKNAHCCVADLVLLSASLVHTLMPPIHSPVVLSVLVELRYSTPQNPLALHACLPLTPRVQPYLVHVFVLQVRTRGGFWRQLRGARGLCQMRLQAQMAAAAAAGATSSGGDDLEVEHWLMVLADKLVQVRGLFICWCARVIVVSASGRAHVLARQAHHLRGVMTWRLSIG